MTNVFIVMILTYQVIMTTQANEDAQPTLVKDAEVEEELTSGETGSGGVSNNVIKN